MHLNPEYSICEVMGRSFLVPTGSATMDVDKMMDLNDTSLYIINCLKEKDLSFDKILGSVLDEYEIDEKIAAEDISEFLDKAMKAGIVLS